MDEELPDYTLTDQPSKAHRFKCAGDVFEAASVIPPTARKLWQRQIVTLFDDEGNLKAADDGTLADRFGEFLDAVLLPESAERLAQRLSDPSRPI